MVTRYCKTFFLGVLIFTTGIFSIGAKEVSMTDNLHSFWRDMIHQQRDEIEWGYSDILL